MHVLTSGWLRRMVNRSAKSPQDRIIVLFDIVQDWMDAPGLREKLHETALTSADQHELKQYLLQLCTEAKVADPEALSNQLLFMLLGAVQQELRAPGCAALEQARAVVGLLLNSQAKQRKSAVWAIAPAVAALFIGIFFTPKLIGVPESAPSSTTFVAVATAPAHVQVNPDRLAAIYQMHSDTRSVQCSYPQALMLPPEQRAIFLENVVFGEGADNSPRTLELVAQLYQKVECYYPPAALM